MYEEPSRLEAKCRAELKVSPPVFDTFLDLQLLDVEYQRFSNVLVLKWVSQCSFL